MTKRLIATAIALVLLLSSCGNVPSGNVGVKTLFNVVAGESMEPGVYPLLPVVERVHTLSTRTVANPEEYSSLTTDSQQIKVDATTRYHINPDKAIELYTKIGKTLAEVQAKIIQPVQLAAVKDVISQRTMTAIIENQSEVSDAIGNIITEKLKGNGFVTLEAFDVTGFSLDPNVQASVELKQIALQELERKDTELATATKEAKRLETLKKALTPEVLMDKAIERWDGTGIPPTVGSNINLFAEK